MSVTGFSQVVGNGFGAAKDYISAEEGCVRFDKEGANIVLTCMASIHVAGDQDEELYEANHIEVVEQHPVGGLLALGTKR